MGASLIEILVTLSIVSFVFTANISMLMRVIIRTHNLEKEVENFIKLERDYEQ